MCFELGCIVLLGLSYVAGTPVCLLYAAVTWGTLVYSIGFDLVFAPKVEVVAQVDRLDDNIWLNNGFKSKQWCLW